MGYTLGNTAETGSNAGGGGYFALPVTMNANYVANTMYGFIRKAGDAAPNKTMFAVIYDSSWNWVDYSDPYDMNNLSTTQAWISVSGFAKTVLTNGSTYYLTWVMGGAWGMPVYGQLKYQSVSNAGKYWGNGSTNTPAYGDTKATWTPMNNPTVSTVSYKFSIYLDASYPGGALPRRALDGPLHIPLRGSVR
jgi:hypothetical protein